MLYVQHNVLLAIKPLFKLCGPRSMFSHHRELEASISISSGLHLLSSVGQESWNFNFFWKQISHIRSLGLPMMANTGSPPLTQFLKTLGNRVSRKLRCYRSDLLLKSENETISFPKSTFWDLFSPKLIFFCSLFCYLIYIST